MSNKKVKALNCSAGISYGNSKELVLLKIKFKKAK